MKKIEKIVLSIIIVVALLIRLYRIDDFLVFMGDEGRDVLVVKGILEGNLTLLGPRASAGDFFTGPIYYYMMAPFLWLWNYDPVGPAIMIALIGTATVFLIYHVGKLFFNWRVGLIASALYAISPLVVTYSRSSWNPNPVPFFSLLTILFFYKAITQEKKEKYFYVVGVLLGIGVQLHYISVFLGAVIASALLLFYFFDRHKKSFLVIIKHYLRIFAGFLLGFSPFLAFEFRHNFQNTKAIGTFIFSSTTEKGYATYDYFLQPILDIFFRIFARLVFNFPPPIIYKDYPIGFLLLYGICIMGIAIAAIITLVKYKKMSVKIILLTWLIVGTLLFGLYKKAIYDYYLVFLFPLPFFIIAYFVDTLMHMKHRVFTYGRYVVSVLLVALIAYNIYGLPLNSPNRQKQQVKRIAEFVISKADNKPFNFALLTSGNSDHAYKYYFSVLGNMPTTIEVDAVDPDRKTVMPQLMVLCEDTSCHPLGHPLYEIAGFGPAKIDGQWDLQVVKIYRLVHETKKDNEGT